MRYNEGPQKIPPKFYFFSLAFLIVAFLSFFRVFNSYELIFYDLRFSLRPPLKISDNIVVVEISDDTLKNLKQWPLPRDYHASLIEVLKEFGVRAIVFDIIFEEPTAYDAIFQEAIKTSGNVYLPVAFYLPEQKNLYKAIPSAEKIIANIHDNFKEGIAGRGHINSEPDADGKIRGVFAFIKYEDKLIPHLSLKVACDWLNLDVGNVEIKGNRIIIDRKLHLPLSHRGLFMVNYPGKWIQSFVHRSYYDILKAYSDLRKGLTPQLNLSELKDAVCFIGLTATATHDWRATPLERIYPMVGLLSSVFNSIIQRQFITDIGVGKNTLLNLLILFISLTLSLRFSPLKAFLANTIFALLYLFFSVAVFIFFDLWIDVFLPFLIITVTYIGSTLHKVLAEIRKRQLLEKELGIARTIQRDFLPSEVKDFAGIDIAFFMQPDKFVAGDLYDIVPLDENRLVVFIGDVSGKGISASLIMAQTISQFRIFTRQYFHCSSVLEHLNRELYGRFEGRFVTALSMMIDTKNSKVNIASAGHAPLILYRQRENRLLEVDLAVGLPLGVTAYVEYSEVEWAIEKGDLLVVFTDGVSEARNRKGEEFGVERIRETILKTKGLDAKASLKEITKELGIFSYACPQHDDITLIVIKKR